MRPLCDVFVIIWYFDFKGRQITKDQIIFKAYGFTTFVVVCVNDYKRESSRWHSLSMELIILVIVITIINIILFLLLLIIIIFNTIIKNNDNNDINDIIIISIATIITGIIVFNEIIIANIAVIIITIMKSIIISLIIIFNSNRLFAQRSTRSSARSLHDSQINIKNVITSLFPARN